MTTPEAPAAPAPGGPLGAGAGAGARGRRLVAVVGRPNVGKSSLVNRVVGRRVAIVEETPGVTRDRHELEAEWAGMPFTIVDTGGWMAGGGALDRQVSAQAERAMREADLVLFVADASVGVTAEDEAVAARLRRSPVPVLLVANKVDSAQREPDAWALAKLGMGDPWMLSALHGRGAGDLLDEVVRLLGTEPADRAESVQDSGPPDGAEPVQDSGPADGAEPAQDSGPPDGAGPRQGEPSDDRGADSVPSVALVGRPNVGKSTLFNRLIRDERSVVHDMPGTTRDAIDTVVETEAGAIRFIDTAGLRRAVRTGDAPEYYSLVRALQAIDRADVALLLIDATEGVTNQDQRLAERVDASGSPIVIVLNKWELLDAAARADVRDQVADRLGFLSYAPVLKVSALTGLGVHRLSGALSASLQAYSRRVPTRELNLVVQAAQAAHAAPGGRVLYAVQGATDPPTFTLFTDRKLPPTYLRFLERRIREHFALGPTALKIRVRSRSDKAPPRRPGPPRSRPQGRHVAGGTR